MKTLLSICEDCYITVIDSAGNRTNVKGFITAVNWEAPDCVTYRIVTDKKEHIRAREDEVSRLEDTERKPILAEALPASLEACAKEQESLLPICDEVKEQDLI